MANEFIQPTTPLGHAEVPQSDAKFSWEDSYQRYSYLALVGFSVLLVYSFWNMFEDTSAFWQTAQYSHGWLVPLIALYLMWSRRPNPLAHEPHEGQAEETFLGFLPASQAWHASIGLAIAMVVGGYYLESSLMQGAGIAIVCLGSMAYVLIGQPFETVQESERWIGMAIILASYAGRLASAQWDIIPLDRFCFVTALGGLFFMVGGMRLIAWAGPAVGFLVFMFPIPSIIEKPLLNGLQKLAAYGSEIVLTILSIPMHRQGNAIFLDGFDGTELDLTVAEACSGLRMLTIFGAMAVAMVFLIRRPWWDKFIILLSAIPIALLVNIIRIVVTALLFYWFPSNEETYLGFLSGEKIHRAAHDGAGWVMMPMALGFLYLEMKILSMLSVPEEGMEIHAASVH